MKPKLLILIIGLCAVFFGFENANAADSGDLPTADDPFWQVMSQINRPDDSTCTSKATTILNNAGLPGGADRADQTCQGIARIITSMQPALAEDGVSTNLFTSTDWHHLQNLYFEADDGKIEFTQEIDFMTHDFMLFLQNLTSRLDMEKDEVALDADIVNGMRNSGTVITMKNASTFDDPAILVNDDEDTDGLVSGLNYDRATNTITFSALHFTSFKAVESSTVNSENPKISKVRYIKTFTDKGKEKIKVIVKGKKFHRDADVKLGSKTAYKTRYSSSKRLVAYFKTKDLKKSGNSFYLKVVNPGDKTDKYDNKFLLDSIQ